MKTIIALVFVVSACSSSKPSREPAPAETMAPVVTPADAAPVGDREQVMQKMQSYADRMCACHDPKCGQQIADEMNAWSREMSNRPDPPDLHEEDMARARQLGERMGTCMKDAMAGSAAK